jgi:hypothetical protein
MRKALVLLSVLLAIGMAIPAYAQQTETLSTVNVEIWPEYDQPSVLIIYHILLTSTTPLPATINLRIPSGAEVTAVAVSDPVKGLLNAPYDRVMQGEWAGLQITANLRDIQVEYYEPLTKNGASRHIVYQWPGDYAVQGFKVTLQQPTGATGLVTDPSLVKSITSQDGFVYYISALQPLKSGQIYTLSIDYQKATDTLSTTGLTVQPVQPLSSNTPGRTTLAGLMPWVLGVLGAILVVVGILGIIFIWRSGTRRTRSSHQHHPQPDIAEENNQVYCSKCGKRAQPGDVFCRTCGTRIQTEE